MVGVLVVDMRKLSYLPIWLLFEQGRAQVAAEPHSLSALTVAVALPAGRTLRCRMRARIGAYGSRGFARGRAPAGSGRFRRKWAPISPWSWTSVRFSAGVVRCRLRRPGETPAPGGVSSRFGLQNRPEVCRWGSRVARGARHALRWLTSLTPNCTRNSCGT